MANICERLHSTLDKYESKSFESLYESLEGISDETLEMHYGLYNGYVDKVNEVNDKLKFASYDSANHNYSEFRELLIEKSNNLNAVVLHELYFSNLTDQDTSPSADFKDVIERDYVKWNNYLENLKAAAMSSRAGWAITAYNYRDGKVQNFAFDQHDIHVPVFVMPLVVIDLWEHAYVLDYGKDKASYINTVIENINWNIVSQRFESCLKHD